MNDICNDCPKRALVELFHRLYSDVEGYPDPCEDCPMDVEVDMAYYENKGECYQ